MAQRHPDNAVYVSGDGLVSFNERGQKLDSLGNVAWGDYQTVSGAGGRRLERDTPPPPQPVRVVYDPLASANTGLPSQFSPPARAASTPATLLAGGVDPATGQKIPTYYNGGLTLPGDDFFMRPAGQQAQGQQWRPPPPNSTAYQAPQQVAPRPSQWRPQMGDPVLSTQRYTYTDPFAVQDPLAGARSYPSYNPLSGQPSGMPFRDPLSGGAIPFSTSGLDNYQLIPPQISSDGTLSFGAMPAQRPALPFAGGFNPSVYDPYP